MSLRDAAQRVLDFIFPPKCLLCGTPTEAGKGELCGKCLTRWSNLISVKCPVCGCDAGKCRCKNKIAAECAAVLFYYDYEDAQLRDGTRLIYSLKRDRDRRSVTFLARELSVNIMRYLNRSGITPPKLYVTNPPRSASAVSKYGFDHAEQLARRTAAYIGAQYVPVFINRGGSYQKNLDAEARRDNADNAICLKNGTCPTGMYLIIDDVSTTGATVNRCADLLRKAGAKDVIYACIAITKNKSLPDKHFSKSDNITDIWQSQ